MKHFKLLARPSIEKQSAEVAAQRSFQYAFAPFVVSLLLGLGTYITPASSDSVLVNTAMEFIALTGIKLSLFISLVICGTALLLVRLKKTERLVSWVSSSVAQFGFTLSSIGIGVCLALGAISAAAGSGLVALKLLLYFLCFTFTFYWIGRLGDPETRKNLHKELKVPEGATYILGVVFLLAGVGGAIMEPFNEVNGVKCKPCESVEIKKP